MIFRPLFARPTKLSKLELLSQVIDLNFVRNETLKQKKRERLLKRALESFHDVIEMASPATRRIIDSTLAIEIGN